MDTDTKQTPQSLFDSMKKEIDKEIDALKSQLEGLVKTHHDQVSSHLQKVIEPAGATGSGARIQAPTSLPWFQHGVRGFLHKLWYGDHPDNPSWYGHQQQQEEEPESQPQECISLSYFSYLREEMKIATNTIFLEIADTFNNQGSAFEMSPTTPVTGQTDVALSSQLDKMMEEFHKKVVAIVSKYMNIARDSKVFDSPAVSTTPFNAPSVEPYSPPLTSSPATKANSTRQRRKRNLPTETESIDSEKILEGQPAEVRKEYYKILLNAQQA